MIIYAFFWIRMKKNFGQNIRVYYVRIQNRFMYVYVCTYCICTYIFVCAYVLTWERERERERERWGLARISTRILLTITTENTVSLQLSTIYAVSQYIFTPTVLTYINAYIQTTRTHLFFHHIFSRWFWISAYQIATGEIPIVPKDQDSQRFHEDSKTFQRIFPILFPKDQCHLIM